MKNDGRDIFQEVVDRDTKGFTFIELLIVVVIMGIMMAVVVPKLDIVGSIDIYSTVRQVKSDIRYTQELAMSKYAKRTIDFTGNSNTYYIKDSSGAIIVSKKLPARSRAIFDSGNTLVFTFNSSGEPVTGAGGILRVSSGGSYRDIEVGSITGRATIQ